MKLTHRFACNTLLRTSNNAYTARALGASLWRRSYSIKPVSASPELPGVDPSKLEITKTSTPKELTPNNQLLFGKTFTGKLDYSNILKRYNVDTI